MWSPRTFGEILFEILRNITDDPQSAIAWLKRLFIIDYSSTVIPKSDSDTMDIPHLIHSSSIHSTNERLH
ncbi:uncharacterized protein HQ_2275A [Haloquadratum walsbyi DSM 16790]|uniref:Uncharacterized protein n=1 Tax=Haloquadratum walsbyi (strain DSM 16790 / HBSQ001) TaxID=362976 RepID=J7SBN3_HALWD|nr:uncharacterized protein HQ_2275A [Haloquadratum walsbyi DSM 16790]